MATGYIVQGDRFGIATNVGSNPTVNFKKYDGQEPPALSPALAYTLEARLLRTLATYVEGMGKPELLYLLKLRSYWTLENIRRFITDNYLFNIPLANLMEMSEQANSGQCDSVLLKLQLINRNVPKVNPAAVYGSKISKKYSEREAVRGAVSVAQTA